MPALDQETTIAIKQLCQQGYEYYDQQDFGQALRLFYQAWVKLPKPQTEFVEAGWVLTALGDTYFRFDKLEQAEEALQSALFCPGILGNPFVHLRLGQSQLLLHKTGEARRSLLKAYRRGGATLFKQEDKKYLQAIKDLIPANPPAVT